MLSSRSGKNMRRKLRVGPANENVQTANGFWPRVAGPPRKHCYVFATRWHMRHALKTVHEELWLLVRVQPFRRAQFRNLGRPAKSQIEHDRVVMAIMRGDRTGAAAAMRGLTKLIYPYARAGVRKNESFPQDHDRLRSSLTN